jgi:NADH:ubiquinone oxidoreductase subunit 5 (subunit L)/multisubunit Na+/H+ antiporter MnhA subunit
MDNLLVNNLALVGYLVPLSLSIIGGFPAMFASSAMITQSSVKVSLAYSSTSNP